MTTIADIFQLTNIESTSEGCHAELRPLLDTSIYRAHFPGSPVTPGACIVNAVEQLLRIHHQRHVSLTGVKNAKFITPIIPTENTVIEVEMTADGTHVSARVLEKNSDGSGTTDPRLCCKLSLCYTIQ